MGCFWDCFLACCCSVIQGFTTLIDIYDNYIKSFGNKKF